MDEHLLHIDDVAGIPRSDVLVESCVPEQAVHVAHLACHYFGDILVVAYHIPQCSLIDDGIGNAIDGTCLANLSLSFKPIIIILAMGQAEHRRKSEDGRIGRPLAEPTFMVGEVQSLSEALPLAIAVLCCAVLSNHLKKPSTTINIRA